MNPNSLNPEEGRPGIVAAGLAVTYGASPVFADLDLHVRPGQISGLIGPSGSGKTTALRALAGLLEPAAGTITYDGEAVPRPGSVGLLAQHPREVCNPRWTLRRIIAEPALIAGSPADPDGCADAAGLDTALLHRYPGQVSDGQLQRACLARVLVQAPTYLLCDEPVAMLDPLSSRAVIATIITLADEGAGVLLVSHQHRMVHALCAPVTALSPALR